MFHPLVAICKLNAKQQFAGDAFSEYFTAAFSDQDINLLDGRGVQHFCVGCIVSEISPLYCCYTKYNLLQRK
jgi:hypothetical protein